MTKKTLRVFFALTITLGLLLSLIGCAPQNDIVIPTLFYHNIADNQLDVQIGHINCGDGTVQWQGETLYRMPLDPKIGMGPGAKRWDGKVLIPFFRENDDVEILRPDLIVFPKHGSTYVYGKDCSVESEHGSEELNVTFVVRTKDGQETRLSRPEGKNTSENTYHNLVLADYTDGQATLIFLEQWPKDDSYKQWENYFHCLVFDFASQQTSLQIYEARPGADIVGNGIPTDNNGIIAGKYYFRDGIALASLDLETGQYTRYEEYRSGIFDRLLPQEKIDNIELYDVTAWEDCLLLDYDCGYSVDKKTGDPLPGRRITVVWQNGKPQAVLTYEHSNAVLTIYNARGKELSKTTFPPEQINTKMFSFQLPYR